MKSGCNRFDVRIRQVGMHGQGENAVGGLDGVGEIRIRPVTAGVGRLLVHAARVVNHRGNALLLQRFLHAVALAAALAVQLGRRGALWTIAAAAGIALALALLPSCVVLLIWPGEALAVLETLLPWRAVITLLCGLIGLIRKEKK